MDQGPGRAAGAGGCRERGRAGNRASREGGATVPRHPPQAPWLHRVGAAVLRPVAPHPHPGAGAGGRRVRDIGYELDRKRPIISTHYDLLIRGGICVLPWGVEATDVGVRDGRIAALHVPADATAEETIDARGLHVLPGLIDPHVHLRDPGDAAVESIPTGTKAAVLGGLVAVFDMPNTKPSIVDAERLAWKQDYVEQMAWCDMGLYVGGTKTNIAELADLELGKGVCAIKVFAGSSTGELMGEDDASLEKVMRSGRRRIAYHSEDEYRLQARKPMFKSGDPYSRHMEWRDEETAFQIGRA